MLKLEVFLWLTANYMFIQCKKAWGRRSGVTNFNIPFFLIYFFVQGIINNQFKKANKKCVLCFKRFMSQNILIPSHLPKKGYTFLQFKSNRSLQHEQQLPDIKTETLDISRAITAESSPLHIASSRNREPLVSESKSLTTKLQAEISFRNYIII